MNHPKPIRCAIYTRKSTEDGLDQEFNSLEAQREAAEAYIKSQQHEGWQVIDQSYEDGGFSGGNMDRPGLSSLMTDIEAGKIDMIVVYKVDRLSRSLHDFAKMVELFDQHGISFVSVTQQFNTSTSMGRLTLNVLLSFAQFEREVTAERIRDKIAASKRKGMWMGGPVPFGYDVIARKLVVNKAEAAQLNVIFKAYLELKSVDRLIGYLHENHIQNKITKGGVAVAHKPFTRHVLYSLLRNPIYLGKTSFKGDLHEGQHAAILDIDIWQQVQDLMKAQAKSKEGRYAEGGSLLKSKLFDVAGRGYLCNFSQKHKHRQYRYYVEPKFRHRIPAYTLEKFIVLNLRNPLLFSKLHLNEEQQYRWLNLLENPASFITKTISRVVIGEQTTLHIDRGQVAKILADRTNISEPSQPVSYDYDPIISAQESEQMLVVTLDYCFLKGSKQSCITRNQHDETLLRAIRKAYNWEKRLRHEPGLTQAILAKEINIDPGDLNRHLNLLLLAPDILTSILDGRQPEHLTWQFLKKQKLPICWKAQHKLLKIPA